MNKMPETSLEAYTAVKDKGMDVTLRRQVAQLLLHKPMTTNQIASTTDHSQNAIRPRVNELIRMSCVERNGREENPSGHSAYINHITPKGRRYAKGKIDPEPEPPLAQIQRKVVDVAREVVRGNADKEILELAVDRHDSMKRRMDPEWDE